MESYTYGSPEGVQALVEAIPLAEDLHYFRLNAHDQERMAHALETADAAGKCWAQRYTGLGLEECHLWPECFAEMFLEIDQLIGLIYALQTAYYLGDAFAGDWLSGLGQNLGVEWI